MDGLSRRQATIKSLVNQALVSGSPSWPKVALALGTIYLFWGSAYLAIRFAVETVPPFFMGGMRFAIAGSLLYALARLRGATRPTSYHWRSAVKVGLLLLVGGSGGVIWASTRVPSGVVALLIASVPLWMGLLDWIQRGAQPSKRTAFGLVLGFAGIIFLFGSGGREGDIGLDRVGMLVVIVAAVSWAAGSLTSREVHLPASPMLANAMELMAGGIVLLVIGFAAGEYGKLEAISPRSALSLSYLIVFGSMIGFNVYIWLLKVTTPAIASTYAYVNPIVAVALGWSLGGELITSGTVTAAIAIVIAVLFMTTGSASGRKSDSELGIQSIGRFPT